MLKQIQEKIIRLYHEIVNSIKHLVNLLLKRIQLSRVRMPKNYFFFLLVVILTTAIVINHFGWLTSLLLGVTLTLFWKIFSGLSWFNTFFIILGLLEISLLSFFIRPVFVFLITLLFWVILYYKLFSPQEKVGRYLSFYFLCFLGIFLVFSLFFLQNQSFWWCYLLYGLGTGIITFFYLVDLINDYSLLIPNLLVIILVNIEIFWLINFLSLPLLLSSLLTFINYWMLISYGEYLAKQIVD